MMRTPGKPPASAEKREYVRVPTAIPSTLSVLADQIALACVVTDLSASGAGVQFDEPAPPAERICRLEISWFGDFEGITTRDGGTSAGVRFLIGEAERSAFICWQSWRNSSKWGFPPQPTTISSKPRIRNCCSNSQADNINFAKSSIFRFGASCSGRKCGLRWANW